MVDGFLGRKLLLTWNGNPVKGMREKGITVNGEPVDVTSDDDDGFRRLLSEPGQKQIDISISGIVKDEVFIAALIDGPRQGAVVMTLPTGGTITGTFHLANVTNTAPYNDGLAFEASLQSTGAFIYGPPAP